MRSLQFSTIAVLFAATILSAIAEPYAPLAGHNCWGNFFNNRVGEQSRGASVLKFSPTGDTFEIWRKMGMQAYENPWNGTGAVPDGWQRVGQSKSIKVGTNGSLSTEYTWLALTIKADWMPTAPGSKSYTYTSAELRGHYT